MNAAHAFASDGWDVTVFDNLSRKGTDINLGYLTNHHPSLRFIKGDICSMEDLKQALGEPYDVLLHLAGQVAVTTSVTDPRSDFKINALGTFNVLEAARMMKKPPLFLFSSTNKVYGGLEDLKVKEGDRRYSFVDQPDGVTEEQNLDFHSPYGCSKGAADQYVRDYGRIYRMPTVVFRQSCIYGPHQMGIEDQGWVAWFMIAAIFGRPVTIYGNGKQVRDLLHVDDLVAVYKAAIAQRARSAGQIYNIGGGAGNTLSLLEFLDMLKNDLKLPITFSFGAERPGDQPMFVSDNAKAKHELGWQPHVSLNDGIPTLHQWLIENKAQLSTLYSGGV